MTFKDLQKIIVQQEEITTQYSSQLEKLQKKPFWIWKSEEHKKEDGKPKGGCCFNHIIGLPKKENIIEKPLFDYEQIIYDNLKNHKHISLEEYTKKKSKRNVRVRSLNYYQSWIKSCKSHPSISVIAVFLKG